eukprot:UN26354
MMMNGPCGWRKLCLIQSDLFFPLWIYFICGCFYY